MTEPKPESGKAEQPARKFERKSCRVKMRCRRAKSGPVNTDKYIEGMVRNQSVGGLMLESPIYFPVGIQLEIAFTSPDDRRAFMGTVTIRWARRLGNAWLLGVATERMDKF